MCHVLQLMCKYFFAQLFYRADTGFSFFDCVFLHFPFPDDSGSFVVSERSVFEPCATSGIRLLWHFFSCVWGSVLVPTGPLASFFFFGKRNLRSTLPIFFTYLSQSYPYLCFFYFQNNCIMNNNCMYACNLIL